MASTEKTARSSYHHGNLLEALLASAIALIEEKGVENLSVREVAKRAGVSPGAPFRHFDSKTALLTAVAEQAIGRLTKSVESEMKTCGEDPIAGLRAIGRGYLNWALANPTHFQVVSSRSLIDFHGSPRLVAENEAIRTIMIDLIGQARENGSLREGVAADDLVFAARAFIYGVTRMWVDGHFQEWKIERPPAEAMNAALDMFMGLIAARSAGTPA